MLPTRRPVQLLTFVGLFSFILMSPFGLFALSALRAGEGDRDGPELVPLLVDM